MGRKTIDQDATNHFIKVHHHSVKIYYFFFLKSKYLLSDYFRNHWLFKRTCRISIKILSDTRLGLSQTLVITSASVFKRNEKYSITRVTTRAISYHHLIHANPKKLPIFFWLSTPLKKFRCWRMLLTKTVISVWKKTQKQASSLYKVYYHRWKRCCYAF